MPHTAPRSDARALIRPRFAVERRLSYAFVAATSPFFLALYVLATPRGWGWIVLGAHAVIVLAFVLVLLRRRRQVIWVTDTALVRIGVFGGPRIVWRETIASVTLVATYRTNAPDTATQLLLQDAAGHRLLRLDGVFWGSASLSELVAALEIPVTDAGDPMTAREFFRRYPGSAFWFQRRGVPTIAVGVILATFTAIVLASMAVTGIPVVTPF